MKWLPNFMQFVTEVGNNTNHKRVIHFSLCVCVQCLSTVMPWKSRSVETSCCKHCNGRWKVCSKGKRILHISGYPRFQTSCRSSLTGVKLVLLSNHDIWFTCLPPTHPPPPPNCCVKLIIIIMDSSYITECKCYFKTYHSSTYACRYTYNLW